jgi:hypothetical protein
VCVVYAPTPLPHLVHALLELALVHLEVELIRVAVQGLPP